MKKVLPLLIVMITAAGLWGQSPSGTSPESLKGKIVLLPFDNYSGSSLKYLATYIPEILGSNLQERGIDSLCTGFTETAPAGIRAPATDRFPGNQELLSIAEGSGATAVVSGRYIVHDKTIRLDLVVVDASTRRVIRGKTVETTIDERFLDTMDRYASNRADWIAEEIPSLVKTDGRFELSLRGVLNWLKGSVIGSLVTSRWSFFVLVLALFALLARMTGVLFRRILPKLTERTETELDNLIVEKARKPVQWAVFLGGGRAALLALGWNNDIIQMVDRILAAGIMVTFIWLIVSVCTLLIREWGRRMTARGDARVYDDLIPLLVNAMKFTVISIGVAMVLSLFDIDIAPFIASLGIAGFAIGFAVKDTLSNIIGGIVLLLDNAFSVGDKVTIDGETGVIREVGLRNTKLATYDNEIVVFSNGELMHKKFKNYVLPDPRVRVNVNFSVAYGSQVERIEETALSVVRSMEGVCPDPAPAVVFRAMGDSALEFQLLFWVESYQDQVKRHEEATRRLYNALNDAGLSIPFPTRTVYLKRED